MSQLPPKADCSVNAVSRWKTGGVIHLMLCSVQSVQVSPSRLKKYKALKRSTFSIRTDVPYRLCAHLYA